MYPRGQHSPLLDRVPSSPPDAYLRRRYALHAFFARCSSGRGTFVATARALAVLLYFLATIFSHRQLFQKPGRFYFRLVNCLYRLGCYTAQSTDYPSHLVSGTVSLRLPPVQCPLPSTFSDTLVRCCCRVSSLPYSATLSRCFATHNQMVSHSVPRGLLHTRLPHGAHSAAGYVSHLSAVPGR